VDPLSAAATGAIAKTANDGAAMTVRLWERVLGPTADVLGGALAQYTEARITNLQRIGQRAESKTEGRELGQIHPRVAHRIIEEGSYADDEIMAEYLSGVLAAGRNGQDQNDDAVSWAALIAQMSSKQLRAHFLFYREWALRLHGQKIALGKGAVRGANALEIEYDDLVVALGLPEGAEDDVVRILGALDRSGLIRQYRSGPVEDDPEADFPDDWSGYVRVEMTISGLELYGWALGEVVTALGFLDLRPLEGGSELPPRPERSRIVDPATRHRAPRSE
jgi:hypothetical protein